MLLFRDLWTVSNGISFLRVLLTLPAGWYIWTGQYHIALWLGVASYISDLLDGWLARKLNEVTEAGKIIDPLADKIFVGTITVLLVLRGDLPLWFVTAIVLRDAIILLAGIYLTRRTGFVLPSNYPGKIAVFCIAFTMFCTVARFDSMLITSGIYAASILMIISFTLYAWRFYTTLKTSPQKNPTS